MVRMAAAHGTTDLVATPHANSAYAFEPERIAERLAELERVSGGALRLYTGCDFHLGYDNIQDALAHPRKYTIHHKNYLLVEFSDLMILPNTSEVFERLQDAGMIPVITHPERNGLLRQRIEEIALWVEQGACVQLTSQSLTGGFGKAAREFSKTLLDSKLVHIVASDGHDCVRRPPALDTAYAWLSERYGEAAAQALCITNPKATLIGDGLSIPERYEPRAIRKWYQFWR
jgi:protein-tyrosine phosphatase